MEDWQENMIDVFTDLVRENLANTSFSPSAFATKNIYQNDNNIALALLRRGFRAPTL